MLAAVAATVAEVTGQACADPEQSLTGLGVDSLQMMQIAARLRTALGTQASLAEMLRASTLGALAEVCADGGGTGPAGPAATGPATPAFEPSDALSTMQQRLWYLWQFDPDSNHYNVPFGLHSSTRPLPARPWRPSCTGTPNCAPGTCPGRTAHRCASPPRWTRCPSRRSTWAARTRTRRSSKPPSRARHCRSSAGRSTSNGTPPGS